MNSINFLPQAPAKLFLVGIGGIGMSSLAQLLNWQGFKVAGSDRGLKEPGKAFLYESLKKQGIAIHPQDGSGVKAEQPDAIIISTAIEEDNPDLAAATDIPLIHRARALSQALARINGDMIAVAGSCGKTSVTGWIASALHALGQNVLVVNGGYYSAENPEGLPGNFLADSNPRWLVVEVDESDKSISEFEPEYGLLLNVGNDHYEQDELRKVFTAFLGRCTKGVATSTGLAELAGGVNVPVSLFSTDESSRPGVVCPRHYTTDKDGISFEATGFGLVKSSQSGRHSSHNAAAVLSLLRLLPLNMERQALAESLAAFQGIRQRFEIMGSMSDGTPLINDYAHNPEKITAALNTARERFGSPVLAFFQPHGFTPLKFMREALKDALANALMPGDTFVMLPVFYAGGTASFTPTSQEVADEMKEADLPVLAAQREDAPDMIKRLKHSCIIVMGARDSSLREWTKQLSKL